MTNPNERMTKAQRHIIMGNRGTNHKNRCQEYGSEAIKKFVSEKFNIPAEKIILENLTKEQAQAVIIHFKPKKGSKPAEAKE